MNKDHLLLLVKVLIFDEIRIAFALKYCLTSDSRISVFIINEKQKGKIRVGETNDFPMGYGSVREQYTVNALTYYASR